jgi:hypothetical protein
VSKTSDQLTAGDFPSRTKRDWQLIVLLGLLVNIILIYPKLTPQLKDIEVWDESGYIYGGKELASGNFENIGRSPLAASFYALTYIPVQGSPDWFVYSCTLGRLGLFGLLWLGSYLVAMRLAEYSSPIIIIGFLLISPALPSIITNGSHALFAAMSSFALWQFISFFREKAIKHLCLASFFVGLAILARIGEGTFLFLVLVGFSILLGINARHITVYLLSSILPFAVIFGAYLLLNFLGTGKFEIAKPGFLYTAFEQGQGVAYQDNYPGRDFMVEGMFDARRLFGTREQHNNSVIAAVRQNPLAYFERIPRLAKMARWNAVDMYGGSLGIVFFLLAVRGAIELIQKKQIILLGIFLGWSSYLILYILIVFQPEHLLSSFLVVFSLASIGLTSVVAAFDKKWERAIWTMALLGLIAYGMARAQPPHFLFGALILLLGLWVVWINMRNSPNREAGAAVSVVLIFCLMLIINGRVFSPRIPHRPEIMSSEESAVLFMRKHLQPKTEVAGYGARDLMAADMTCVTMVRSNIPDMVSDQDLREWMTKNKVKAIYLDGNLKSAQPETWTLVERSIGKSLEVAFTSDDGNIRLLTFTRDPKLNS